MIIDAHLHLQEKSLESLDFDQYFSGVQKALVNGTGEDDWAQVAELCERYPEQVIPFFGIHPWKVSEQSDTALSSLKSYLQRFSNAGVGEIGIDKWVLKRGGNDGNFELQKELFAVQLELATELNRSVTIHCLKAWGTLKEMLSSRSQLPPFLLHAYSGPKDFVEDFSEMGAYFSFSPYFLKPEKAPKLEPFEVISEQRLLIETDAPGMLGPEMTWSEAQRAFSESIQHPANIEAIYRQVAAHRSLPLEGMKKSVQENLERFLQVDEKTEN